MEDGYIKLFRSSLNNPLFKKSEIWHLWEYLMLRANYEDKKIIWNKQEMIIKRGSLIFGRKNASLDTGISERTIRTGLITLQQLGMIEKSTTKSTSKFSYLSVCNYDKFQLWGIKNDQQIDQQVTSKRPASDQQVTTDKNDKNIKNIKNKPFPMFDIFWSAYPKKKSKGDAEKAWLKIRPDNDLFKKMLLKIEIFIETEQWQKDGGKYIPHPATWLNAKGWEDELPEIGHQDGMDLWLKVKEEQDARIRSKEILALNEKIESNIPIKS